MHCFNGIFNWGDKGRQYRQLSSIQFSRSSVDLQLLAISAAGTGPIPASEPNELCEMATPDQLSTTSFNASFYFYTEKCSFENITGT